MAWFGWDKAKEETATTTETEAWGMTASEFAMRQERARMAAFDAATLPPLVVPSSWVSTAAGVSSIPIGTSTGTRTTTYDPDADVFCGFERGVLMELHQVLVRNNINQRDLREIVDTYCRVKRRVDK